MIPSEKKRSSAYWRAYAYFIDCKGDDAWMRSASNRREYNDFLLGKRNAEKDLLAMEKSYVPNSKLFQEELDRLIANNPPHELRRPFHLKNQETPVCGGCGGCKVPS